MCRDCVSFSHLMRQWKVTAHFVNQLIRSQHLKTHEHGPRTTITRESVEDCQWRIAVVRAAMADADN